MESIRLRYEKEEKDLEDLEEEAENDKFVREALLRLDAMEAQTKIH